MNSKNLISVYQSCEALEKLGSDVLKKYGSLKSHEIRVLNKFCTIMVNNGCSIEHLDSFFISYSIGQISKEFDLLRFGTSCILDIELKSELKRSVSENRAKIHKQMYENYYYLNFLNLQIIIFAFVENDGFYIFNVANNSIQKISPSIVAKQLINQSIDEAADPDKLFIPSNYLISPFNSTKKFINGEYFLTSAQQKNKEEIKSELLEVPMKLFCLSANAGTGKTLLLYDIAKDQLASKKHVLIIHCGNLNNGHCQLKNEYGWDILSIKLIPNDAQCWEISNIDLIIVDESQRIRVRQLNTIIQKSLTLKIPVIFSYDTKQYLKSGETTDIFEYIKSNYPTIPVSIKTLTNKIRTNKQMASFISNLLSIGSSRDNLQYDCISIEYFDNETDLSKYINDLTGKGWTPITYTTSSRDIDPYDDLSEIVNTNAHAVIGQEFRKVVFVMDNNFKYSESGKLMSKKSYYSARGMLYQIVTRAIDELKIIVLENADLYKHLLEIKEMSNGGLPI